MVGKGLLGKKGWLILVRLYYLTTKLVYLNSLMGLDRFSKMCRWLGCQIPDTCNNFKELRTNVTFSS